MNVDETPGSMEMAKLRRERKRQTDRNAQREHRKRQKQYIEELEAQITLLKSPGPSETSQLATQNIRLREELKQMHSLWDEMETILQRQRELRQQSIISPFHSCGNPSDDVDRDNDPNSQAFTADSLHIKNDLSNHFAPHQEPNMTHEASEPIGLSGLEDFMLHEPPTASHMPETLCQDTGLDLDTNFDMLATNDDSIDRILIGESHLFDESHTDNISVTEPSRTAQISPGNNRQQSSSALDQVSTITVQTNCSRSHGETCALTQNPRRSKRATDVTPCEQDQTSWEHYATPRQPDTLDGFMELFGAYVEHCIPALGPTIWSIDGEPQTPMLLSPPSPRDQPLHNMIERASKNPVAIGPPTLVDFLFDNPTNTLSVDLKKYLAPVQKVRRTSEFLATYWVLYLFLRWQILRTDEAYQSLPPWFRPTPLQRTILHPVTADLIAWPEIREGLIHMSLEDSEALQEVSADVGKYLTVDISVAEHDLLNDPQQIASQILNLANWTLDTKFFDQYPQWNGIASARRSSV
ncbi:hypothetical protein NCS57_01464500 [Fusarium keratoplasticum]|uniref:Uncharacterized protein n=1 Tax=Fusarium keratoplasticum TaxID=1328300 RepID=A0ACC0QBG6_9HYPO|nr:hypothetical protein NCS57_01464500 [Fusarium keratoplasticum]KAI8649279.1 hypothetical protein NCS57_01464500 [Fusarium keratoplasticum]